MELIDRHRASVAPMLAFDTDIVAAHAEGIWVHDADGNRWADFACGTAVTNLGHNHPAVIEAAHAQIDKFVHSGSIFRYEGIVSLAESLRGITPDGIEKFGFANSGSEAVEASVKLAKYTTKRQGVVAFRGGFHGRTLGSVAYTTSNAKYRDGYHPILGSVFIAPFPHPYRWGMSESAATDRALDELLLMLKHEVRPSNIAAFLVEPLQGEGGYYPAPPDFLGELRSIADEHGISLVFDEVQTGFGRTAEWFASDHYDVDPDIIAMGRASPTDSRSPPTAPRARSSTGGRWAPTARPSGAILWHAQPPTLLPRPWAGSSIMPGCCLVEPSKDSTSLPSRRQRLVMFAASA